MRYRMVIYDTNHEDKYMSYRRYELFGDKESIWVSWNYLKNSFKHIEIYSLDGHKQEPEKGISGLVDYNP